MLVENIYKKIAWKALEIFHNENLSSNFVPALKYKTEDEQRKAFAGDHYDSARIALTWLFLQLKKRHIIQDRNVFDFACNLQQFLPSIVDERWETIGIAPEDDFCKEKADNFAYPEFLFDLDGFSIKIKPIVKRIDENRVALWKSKLPVFATFKRNKECDVPDNTGEYWQIPEKKILDGIEQKEHEDEENNEAA